MPTKKPFSAYLPYAGMVGDGVVITKDALLLRTFRVYSRDFSYADDGTILQCLQALNNSFRFFGDGWTVYLDAFRRKVKSLPRYFDTDAPEAAQEFDSFREQGLGELYESEFYVTFAYVIPNKKKTSSFLFKTTNSESINGDVQRFISLTDDMHGMYRSVFAEVDVLDSSQMLTYLHSTFAPNHTVKMPEVPFYLDSYLADQRFIPDAICRVNGDYVQTASIHDFPSETHAGLMSKIMKLPYEFRICTRFTFIDRDTAKSQIKAIRKHHFQKRKGIGSFFSEAVLKEESALEDTESLAATTESSEALSTLADGNINFGYLTTSFIVRDSEYGRSSDTLAVLKKAANDAGFICKTETFNNPIVFLGCIPGNINYNARKPLVSTRNFAHFFPLSDSWVGRFTNEHIQANTGVSFPHIITKANNSAHYLNLNVGDVGHTLILGPTGAGKSILLGTLCMQFFRYPATRIYFFDKDKSSEAACRNVGGSFFDVGSDESTFKMNPFFGLDQISHRTWFSNFLANFFRSKDITVSTSDEQEIYNALESMAAMKLEDRTFATLRDTVQIETIRSALHPFIEGEYAALFDTIDDSLHTRRWTTFEMNTLMSSGNDEIVRFVLLYIFYRLEQTFDGTHTLLVLDEAWLMLDHPLFADMLRNFLKTLRKKNVYIILATQEVADAKNKIFSTILNACMTKILLPNQQALQEENAALYHSIGLENQDILALAEGTPKKHYFYLSPEGKQMFELGLEENQLALLKKVRIKETAHA